MKTLKNALRMSGAVLAMAMFSVLLLPAHADAEEVTLVSVEGATADENDTVVDVRVRLSNAVSSSTSVKFATSNDTAKAGEDFYGTFQTATFSPGQTVQVVRLQLINDDIPEYGEQFNVRIFGVESNDNVVTGATHAKVSIRDDDRPTTIPIVNVSGTTINEGARFVDVRIRLGGPALTQRATVKFATASNSAQAGQDFYGTFQTITFEPGETVQVARIQMVDDDVAEPNENFMVRIWDGQNIEVRTSRAFVQINDND